METREQLLNQLGQAVTIIRQLGNIQQQLNNTRASYRNAIPLRQIKPLDKRKYIIGGIFLVAYAVYDIFCCGGQIVSAIIGLSLYFFVVYKIIKRNKKIILQNEATEQQNLQIIAQNEQVKIKEQNILNELEKIQNVYRERISPWYPIDYCSIDAVEFLYNAINNYRADSLKEAINLYETTLHQQRVEANQKKALRQQTLGNLLSAGSLVMQGATLGAINNQTSAINNQTASVNNVNDTLNRIRRGY